MITLALAILRAQDIHENSWDVNVGAYRIGKKAACQLACGTRPDMERIVYLLISQAWSDSAQWAADVKYDYDEHKNRKRPKARLYAHRHLEK